VLSEALLQRMQAVVRAAHAQAAEEDKATDERRREQTAGPAQVVPRALRSLPKRTKATSNGSRLPPGTVPTMRPPSSPVGWSHADDDTSPLPRLNASGEIATSDVDGLGTKLESTAQRNGAQPNYAAAPGHVLRRDRAVKGDRRGLAAAAQAPADLLEHPRPRAQKAAVRRRYQPATFIAAALVLVAGGSLAVVMSSNGSKPTSRASSAAASAQVAAWVANQVSPTAAVACDPAMCRALSAKGVDKLVVLGSTASSILHSDVVVATAAVRKELGGRLGLVYAPAVIASFGSGKERIDIRVVARKGPTAFEAALATDLQNRRQYGAALLTSARVAASGPARREILDGQVTPQLLMVFANLAAGDPIDIVAFGDAGPGASAGMPLRSAELAESGGAAVVEKWLSVLQIQHYPFLPAVTKTIRLDGKPLFFIEYAAPSPLGLLSQ
jgi:hypothetical protein